MALFPCDCTCDGMKRASYHGGSAFSFSSGIYYQIGSDTSGGCGGKLSNDSGGTDGGDRGLGVVV